MSSFSPDFSAVAIDDMLHDDKTDASAFEVGILVKSAKFSEQVPRGIRVKSDTIVADEQSQFIGPRLDPTSITVSGHFHHQTMVVYHVWRVLSIALFISLRDYSFAWRSVTGV